jgi:hypothetical protein
LRKAQTTELCSPASSLHTNLSPPTYCVTLLILFNELFIYYFSW